MYAARCMKAGAHGYLMKNQPFDDVIQAIHMVYHGEQYFNEETVKKVLQELLNGKNNPPLPINQLSKREFEIFELIGDGLRPRHIAKKLFINTGTVDAHCKNIRLKLDSNNMTELIEVAAEWGKQNPTP